MPVDILQNRHASVVDADFDEVGGGVSCENYHFLAYGAIYWAEPR